MTSLLSIDWDYFVLSSNMPIESMIESKKNVVDLWYKRFLQGKGESIYNSFQLSNKVNNFWDNIKHHFRLNDDVKIYVSDSHSLSYELAKKFHCHEVYLFDAHSDLGYSGSSSFKFGVNCANWLGFLLKNQLIQQAHIVYSPFTKEKPQMFNQMIKKYNVEFTSWKDLKDDIDVPVIHICRSGAWTPPWLDSKFYQFVRGLRKPYKVVNCPKREWNINQLTYADKIQYLMS